MTTAYKMLTIFSLIALSASLNACQSTPTINKARPKPITNNPILTPENAAQIAPWAKPAINNNETDPVYRQQWLQANSKSLCPILALPKRSSAHLSAHTVRRAEFSGGWGVAYDLPNLRSAYGVANAGTMDPKDAVFSWPYKVRYSDGSTVGYGHEGGNPTAKWLAYIVIPQNRCFYNVWSAQGKTHLEQMMADLRQVNP